MITNRKQNVLMVLVIAALLLATFAVVALHAAQGLDGRVAIIGFNNYGHGPALASGAHGSTGSLAGIYFNNLGHGPVRG